MKRLIISAALLLFAGCSQFQEFLDTRTGEEPLRAQFPIYTWGDEIVIRCAGALCPWPIPNELKASFEDQGLPPGDYVFKGEHFTTAILWKPAHTELKALDAGKDPCAEAVRAGYECSPNYYVQTCTEPNDALYRDQWAPGFVKLPEAWEVQRESADVYIFVLDSGVSKHPDLLPALDLSLGFDAIGTDPTDDQNGHGTHVAGIIGALGNNAAGVAGATWKTKIIPVRFLSATGGGSIYDAVRAVDYITHIVRERGIKRAIVNASWGSRGYSQPLESAIRAATEAGILFIAAAGNSGTDNDIISHYPSNFSPLPGVVAVASIEAGGSLASYSNFGVAKVDIAAPGSDILSTFKQGGYARLSGTSMAAPQVSGIASLAWQRFPGKSARDIEMLLSSSSTKRGKFSKTIKGGAQVDALGAVTGQPSKCYNQKFKTCVKPCDKLPTAKRRSCRVACRVKFNCWQ